MSAHANASTLTLLIHIVQEEIKKRFNVDWRPTIEIDKDKAEYAAIHNSNLKFYLCQFHLVKALSEQFAKYFRHLAKELREKKVNELIRKFYKVQR